MRKVTFLLFLLFITSGVFPISFNSIGVNESLAQLSVMSIHQDEYGRMWFGTNEGLSIYDGEQIITYKTITNPDGSPVFVTKGFHPGYQVNAIVSDRDKDIYLLISNSLIRYNIRKQRFTCLQEGGVNALAAIDGEIWYASSDSVLVWDGKKEQGRFTLRLNIPADINEIHRAKDNTLWLGTFSGLYNVDTTDNRASCVIPQKDIHRIFEAANGDMWIGCRMEGMYRISKKGEVTRFNHEPSNANSIASNQVRTFAEGKNGEIWIGTFNGLQTFNPATGEYTTYKQSNQPGGLTHSSIFSLYTDRQETIWIGTYYGGVNYFNPESDIFTRYHADDDKKENRLSYSFVGNMIEDKDHNLWVCTEGGGLNKLDRKSNKIKQFRAEEGKNSIAHNNLKSICYDSKRHMLYIGTHTGGLSRYDIGKDRFINYLDLPGRDEMPNDIIHKVDIYNDSLLVMARNGLFAMDLETGKTTKMFPELSAQVTYGTNFIVDSKGYIWILRINTLVKIRINRSTDNHTYHSGLDGLDGYPIKEIFEAHTGEIYVGTQGAGIFRLDEKANTFLPCTRGKGQPGNDYCYRIAETKQQNLIVSTNKGIFLFDPRKNEITETINLGNKGLLISSIYESCGLYISGNGEIFVGGADGMVSFFEKDLPRRNIPYNIYFSELHIAHKTIYPDSDTGILKESLPYTGSITLSHKQNNLTFYFASNNYAGILGKSTYEYRLEGFSEEWIPTNGNHIYYTNLNPGKYLLKVRQRDTDNHFSPAPIELPFTIKEPFYATVWAYILYVLLTASIIFVFAYFKYSKMKLATSLNAEKKDKERIEELNQSKLRFFTNISHEFRTPLTLIIAQLELILQNASLSPAIYNKILKVYKHTHQMRQLINELLDFRKFEQRYTTLNVSEQNIVAFVWEIYLSFQEYAAANGVNFRFGSEPESAVYWFDAQQMRKVFYNLISNAFKYTGRGGSIEVNILEEENGVNIRIIDTGVGIEKKDLGKIFDRFYQAEDTPKERNTGTGIGLALTKSIVERHHGEVLVESTPGYGSIFCVHLKKGRKQFEGDTSAIIVQKTDEAGIQPDTLPDTLLMKEISEEFPASPDSDKGKPTILIVEDNEELLHILLELFSPLYHTIPARDGEEGLRKAISDKPDLILSDVMMPVMTGTEMCMRIKNNLDTCHVPVVLLTAFNSNEQNMEGLQRGADDYIGKPFNATLLLARCNNLIRNRRLLQKKYYGNSDADINLLATNQLDSNFMNRVEAVIKENLDNMDFDINRLAQEMAMGRSTLFSKFKGLTGMTPNEFILNYKLKQASILLRTHPDMQIAQISDSLGFSSPRYFGKCFKDQFSMSPLEYKRRKDG